jgi:hypothetical protein
MSERILVSFDAQAGEIRTACTQTPAQDFPERVAGLLACSEEQFAGERLARVAALCCDGCGLIVSIDPVNARLPDGWVSDERGELCPECR